MKHRLHSQRVDKNYTGDGHWFAERFGAFFVYFALNFGCRTFQMALPDSSTMYFIGKE